LPVVNAQTDEEIKAEIRANDIKVTEELNAKLKAAQETKLLRFHMSGLQMSDRVRKLFDLQNGNQKEVIKAQKQLGMEVFQLRPGDTGSSAVQGTFSKYIIRYVLFAVFFVSCFSCWNHHATFAVIALTTHIQQMQAHIGRHRKDNHNKRNLQRMLTRRRKVLDYMERKEFEAYRRVVKTLGLVRTK
jgi:small subunit ribosomal protein S15